MTGANEASDRRSDRVTLHRASADVRRALRPGKAPETLLSVGTPSRVSRRRLSQIDRDLSDRERALLNSVHDFRFLTSRHLQAMHFINHATELAAGRVCRRVLQRLSDLRVIEHLERRIGGIRAGSASYVWRVGPVGDRLLRTRDGYGARSRRREPSIQHLDHCLAIADCYLAVSRAAHDHEFELLRAQTEPGCWRSYLDLSGARTTLKPDLYAVTASGNFEDHWFIEVDCGTESLPTLIRKCQQYEIYRRTGQAQHADGVFPLVLWVMSSERRADRLGDAIQSNRSLDAALFRVASSQDQLLDLVRGNSS